MVDLLEPMNVLTFGLLVFAGAQVWVTYRGEVYRRQERAADEASRVEAEGHELDLAYQTLWAEHFRLEALADHLEAADLVQMSLSGVLRSEDLLPRDWATQTRMLGRLGIEAGYLGGVAITHGYDVARQISEFNQALADLFSKDDDRTAGLKSAHVRTTVGGSRLQMYENAIRKGVRDLSLLMWDAIQHSPRGDIIRALNFRNSLSSALARQAVAALQARANPAGHPGSEQAQSG